MLIAYACRQQSRLAPALYAKDHYDTQLAFFFRCSSDGAQSNIPFSCFPFRRTEKELPPLSYLAPPICPYNLPHTASNEQKSGTVCECMCAQLCVCVLKWIKTNQAKSAHTHIHTLMQTKSVGSATPLYCTPVGVLRIYFPFMTTTRSILLYLPNVHYLSSNHFLLCFFQPPHPLH